VRGVLLDGRIPIVAVATSVPLVALLTIAPVSAAPTASSFFFAVGSSIVSVIAPSVVLPWL
jgi:hypothetical protein